MTPDQARCKYNLGRDLTRKLIRQLPHVTIGRVGRGALRRVQEAHMDALITRASELHVDLWELAKDETGKSTRELLAGLVVYPVLSHDTRKEEN